MYMTLDVECRGLFGEAFAVGYVVTERTGVTVFEGLHSCPYVEARPDMFYTTPEEQCRFIEQQIVPALPDPDCSCPEVVRAAFLRAWIQATHIAESYREPLALVADVPYPCETNFLLDVQRQGRGSNQWQAETAKRLEVYPLFDVATALHMRGYPALAKMGRNEGETPEHNPLHDARQSSRIWHTLERGERLQYPPEPTRPPRPDDPPIKVASLVDAVAALRI